MPIFQKNNVGMWAINEGMKRPEQFVKECDDRYNQNLLSVANGIKGKLEHKNIVMLSGPSASGKTTTAHKLANYLKQIGVYADVVSLDDFYKGKGHYPIRPDGSEDFECLEALDVPCINECLAELVETGKSTLPIFDFDIKQRSSKTREVTLSRDSALIIEGIHALNPELVKKVGGHIVTVYATAQDRYFDEHTVLKTNDIRLIRRMVRDYKFRSTGGEITIDLWPHVCEGEDLYIKPYRTHCDYFINTSFGYEPGLYGPYLGHLLGKTPFPQATRILTLLGKLAIYTPIDAKMVAKDAMVREFIGEQEEEK